MQSETSHSFKKTLPQTSCGPAFKLCLPSELVTRFMSKFIDVDFNLRDAATQRQWQVSIGPRRNKAKFEYLLLGWRRVCEQTDMQVGDEVHFTVLDAHMEFRVSRDGAFPPPKAIPPPATPRIQGPLCTPTSASSLEDKFHLDQLRRLDGCSEFQPMAGSSLTWPLGPSHPSPRPCYAATSRDASDFPHLPSLPFTGPGGTPHDTLGQVLNLCMGLGLEGLLDGEREELLLPSSPMSSSLSRRGRKPMTASGLGHERADADNLFFDTPFSTRAPSAGKGSPEVEPTANWPFMRRSSNPDALMSWVPQHTAQNADLGKATSPSKSRKRRCDVLESPWKDASAMEPFPYSKGQKSQQPSPRISTARTTPVKGSPGTQLQGSSIREQSMQVLQGCKSADLGGEILALKRALQQEKDRADCAEEDIAQLLQAMKGAELVVERQTSLGMEGIGKIFDAANHLVSAEMLHHLQLIKAQGLGSLQVQMKHQANLVLEALAQIQALTGFPKKKLPKSEDMESMTFPPGALPPLAPGEQGPPSELHSHRLEAAWGSPGGVAAALLR